LPFVGTPHLHDSHQADEKQLKQQRYRDQDQALFEDGEVHGDEPAGSRRIDCVTRRNTALALFGSKRGSGRSLNVEQVKTPIGYVKTSYIPFATRKSPIWFFSYFRAPA
jgi:hypothetical protein